MICKKTEYLCPIYLGFERDDAELSNESILDLLEFPEAPQELLANPVFKNLCSLSENPVVENFLATNDEVLEYIENSTFKSLLMEKREADKAGAKEELMQRWEADILPYVRCRQ